MIGDNRPAAFIDSNVWLYASLNHDPMKQRTAVTLVRGVAPVVSVQVVNEVCVNLLRKAGCANARVRRLVQSFYRRCAVIGIDRDLPLDAAELRDLHSLSYWDSLIVAAADRSGATVLYSEDLQNGLVVRARLRIENPFHS